MPLGYAAIDTGLSEDQIRTALAELDAAGLVSWDEDTDLVLDREALEVANYRSEGDNRVKSAVKLIQNLPASSLVHEFRALTARYAPALERALSEAEQDRSRLYIGEVQRD